MYGLSPDAKYVWTTKDETTRVERLDGTHFDVLTCEDTGIAWSPNSQFIAGFAAEPKPDRPLTVWRVSNGEIERVLHQHTGVWRSAIAWSPDSQRIASGVNGDSVLISTVFENAEEKLRQKPLVLPHHLPHEIAWSFDGRWLAVTSPKGRKIPTLRLWSVNDAIAHRSLCSSSGNEYMQWSPTGYMLCGQVVGNHIGTLVFNEFDRKLHGRRLVPINCPQKYVVWSPDGSMIVYSKAQPNRMTILETKIAGACYQIPLRIDHVLHNVTLICAKWTADSKSLFIFYQQWENLIVQIYCVADEDVVQEFLLPNCEDIQDIQLFGPAFVILDKQLKQRVFALDLWKPQNNKYFPPFAKRLIFALMCVRNRLLSPSLSKLPVLPLEIWLIFCEFLFVEETQSLDHLRG